jgi:uncharacterized membrane protein YecN with MAPEG domain
MTPIIVPGYAAIFVFIFVFLAVRVIRLRQKYRIGIGAGGHADLERYARVHGNFAEYVPFSIIMLAFMEMQGQSRWLIHFLAIILLIARLIHIYGVSQQNEVIAIRATGMAMTFGVMLVSGIVLLINVLRAATIS